MGHPVYIYCTIIFAFIFLCASKKVAVIKISSVGKRLAKT